MNLKKQTRSLSSEMRQNGICPVTIVRSWRNSSPRFRPHPRPTLSSVTSSNFASKSVSNVNSSNCCVSKSKPKMQMPPSRPWVSLKWHSTIKFWNIQKTQQPTQKRHFALRIRHNVRRRDHGTNDGKACSRKRAPNNARTKLPDSDHRGMPRTVDFRVVQCAPLVHG